MDAPGAFDTSYTMWGAMAADWGDCDYEGWLRRYNLWDDEVSADEMKIRYMRFNKLKLLLVPEE